MRQPSIKRRAVLVGGSAAIAFAGVGVSLAVAGGAPTVHLTAARVVQAAAPALAAGTVAARDTDVLQHGDQTGSDATPMVQAPAAVAAPTAEAPTTEAPSAEAPSIEPDNGGGHADAAGSAGPDGNFNN